MKPGARHELFARLAELNPNPTTELIHHSSFELLIAVILSLLTFVDDLVVNPLAGTSQVAEVAQRMRRRARCYEPDPEVLERLSAASARP